MIKFNKINLKKINYKNICYIIVYIMGFILLIYNIYEVPIVKNKFPIFERYAQAYRYQYLAKQMSPGSISAKRLNAMADALRHNRTEYTFESKQLPPMAK